MMCGLIETKTVCQMVSSAKRTFVFKFQSQLFPLVNHRVNTEFRVIGNKERTINPDKVLQKYRILTSNPSFKHACICTHAHTHTPMGATAPVQSLYSVRTIQPASLQVCDCSLYISLTIDQPSLSALPQTPLACIPVSVFKYTHCL